MVTTIYLVDNIRVTMEEYFNFLHNHKDGHEFNSYCICNECGKKLLVSECCTCEIEE